MSEPKLSSATARVKLLIEVGAGSSWGATRSLDQIYRQAGQEAQNMIERIFREAKCGVRIHSCEVTAVAAVEGVQS